MLAHTPSAACVFLGIISSLIKHVRSSKLYQALTHFFPLETVCFPALTQWKQSQIHPIITLLFLTCPSFHCFSFISKLIVLISRKSWQRKALTDSNMRQADIKARMAALLFSMRSSLRLELSARTLMKDGRRQIQITNWNQPGEEVWDNYLTTKQEKNMTEKKLNARGKANTERQ